MSVFVSPVPNGYVKESISSLYSFIFNDMHLTASFHAFQLKPNAW